MRSRAASTSLKVGTTVAAVASAISRRIPTGRSSAGARPGLGPGQAERLALPYRQPDTAEALSGFPRSELVPQGSRQGGHRPRWPRPEPPVEDADRDNA